MRTYLLLGAASTALTLAPAHAQDNAPTDAPQTSEQREEVVAENTIIVSGRAQKLYRAEETSSGKLETPPLESSLVITTITEQLIED